MRSTRRNVIVLESVAAISMTLASLAIVWTVVSTQVSPAAAPAAGGLSRLEGTELSSESLTTGVAYGKDDTPVVIMEFSDFQCPFCGKYARETLPLLQRDFIEPGKATYIFRDLPLESIHPFAFKAAEAARCAGEQNRHWQMHQHLFEDQKALELPALVRSAASLGLDQAAFEACLDGKMADRVRKDLGEAERLGIQSTPSFLIAKRQKHGAVTIVKAMSGAQTFEAFKAAIEAALGS